MAGLPLDGCLLILVLVLSKHSWPVDLLLPIGPIGVNLSRIVLGVLGLL